MFKPNKLPAELGGEVLPPLRWPPPLPPTFPLYRPLPPFTALYPSFLLQKSASKFALPKKCFKGSTLSPKWPPCGPKGAPLVPPVRPKPSKYGVLPWGNTHFHKIHKSHFWATLGTVLAPRASLTEPKGAQGGQKGPKMAPIWEPVFSHFSHTFYYFCFRF